MQHASTGLTRNDFPILNVTDNLLLDEGLLYCCSFRQKMILIFNFQMTLKVLGSNF